MIEIDIGALAKRRVWVRPTPKRRGHYREITRSAAAENEVDKVITRYERRKEISGKLPTYDSTPSKIKIPDDIITKTNEYANVSLAADAELSAPLDLIDGKVEIGDYKIGEKNKCVFPSTGALGMYHTHPYKVVAEDSFSIADILYVINHDINVMMAHTISPGKNAIWMAVRTVDTVDKIRSLDEKVEEKMMVWKAISHDLSISYKTTDRHWRSNVYDLCEIFKIKLYYGAKGNLKEYKGDW